MGTLEHNHIVKFYGKADPGKGSKETWLVMERCDLDLKALRKKRTLKETEAIYLAYQILLALIYIHQEGIMHR